MERDAVAFTCLWEGMGQGWNSVIRGESIGHGMERMRSGNKVLQYVL